MKKLRTIFLGTPDFSIPVLEMLTNHHNIELVQVITMPDRPAGRGQEMQSPPVAMFAKEKKIPLLQTENINKEEAFFENFNSTNTDLIIVLAFAQFLGTKILALPKLGCFNIHTSLLPKYRGAAPIQYALWNGDKSTGVSIQKMVKKMDAGDLAHSHPLPILENETGG
jgi:methionyl-tRNA formyltransferase